MALNDSTNRPNIHLVADECPFTGERIWVAPKEMPRPLGWHDMSEDDRSDYVESWVANGRPTALPEGSVLTRGYWNGLDYETRQQIAEATALLLSHEMACDYAEELNNMTSDELAREFGDWDDASACVGAY